MEIKDSYPILFCFCVRRGYLFDNFCPCAIGNNICEFVNDLNEKWK